MLSGVENTDTNEKSEHLHVNIIYATSIHTIFMFFIHLDKLPYSTMHNGTMIFN